MRIIILDKKSKRAERTSRRPSASIENASLPISDVHGVSSQETVLLRTLFLTQPKRGMHATLIGPEHRSDILDLVSPRTKFAGGLLLILIQACTTLRNMVELDPSFGIKVCSHGNFPPLAMGGARMSGPVAVGGAAVLRSVAASPTGLIRLHGSAPSRHFRTPTFSSSNPFNPHNAVDGNNLLGARSSSPRVLALALSRGDTPPRRRTRVLISTEN